MRPPTCGLYTTWSMYKYYQQQLFSHKRGQGIAVIGAMRNWLLLNRTVCNHSTENSHTAKWEIPCGYDSRVKVYHPVMKEKVPLILLQEKLAQWYACGPTVYDNTHIGHASSYVRMDIIRRILASTFDIDTMLVMGVTDIDDKIINRSKQAGQSFTELTRFYESEFFESLAKLNVSPPSLIVRVTEHIPQIINFIAGIESKGLTYRTPDGSVYFDVGQYGRYGVFAGLNQSRTPEVDSQKKAAQDFALWKASKPGEPVWDSPWGKGRPGWHIECSAMASDIFGANFDIHTGGEDLAFPHHENELAQSCAYHGRSQWANYWIHTGHLFLSGQTDKMSKSLKNVLTVSEFLQDYSPNHFRMLCLLNHYRNRIEFSSERMEKAVSTVAALSSIISRCNLYVKGQIDCPDIPEDELYERLHATRRVVEAAYADDFNTPRALAHLMRLVKFTNQLLGERTDGKQSKSVRSPVAVAVIGEYVGRVLKQLGLDVGGQKIEDDTETRLQLHKVVDTVVLSRARIREFSKDRQFLVRAAEEVGVCEDQAVRLMKKLYKPLWDISDKIRVDILSSASVQISDDTVNSTWSFVDVKIKSADLGDGPRSRDISQEGVFTQTTDDKKQSQSPSQV